MVSSRPVAFVQKSIIVDLLPKLSQHDGCVPSVVADREAMPYTQAIGPRMPTIVDTESKSFL